MPKPFAYKRGVIWWIRAFDPALKKMVSETTELRVLRPDGTPDPTAKRKAREIAQKTQRLLDDAARDPSAPLPIAAEELTVRRYAGDAAHGGWLRRRRDLDLDWKNDRSRLDHHVLPVIGDMLMSDVRPKNLAALVHAWRTTKLETTGEVMAPRSVRNVYSVVSAMFRDAAIDGVIEQSPCILTERQLGPVIDKDPLWRESAVFTREEAETLISDARIPTDRRLYYGLELLAGMRPGEIAALRVSSYDASIEPLGKLTIAKAHNTRKNVTKGTKTNAVRYVPVHATLAAMLGEWLLSGYEAMVGRKPEPGDLLLPLPPKAAEARRSREGEPIRTGDYAGKRWREEDLPMLEWRSRKMYDGKATFISLAVEDGANRDVIEYRVTHAKARRSAFDGYDRGAHWRETCAEISKLKISRRRGGLTLVALK